MVSADFQHHQLQLRTTLIVGNYCHDTLIFCSDEPIFALGGSVAYIAPLLKKLQVPSSVVAKVGSDFRFLKQLLQPPIVLERSATTEFSADFRGGGERCLRVGNICEPIFPDDLPDPKDAPLFDLGLAVGVAGEILPETLQKLSKLVKYTVVDLQALLREIDPLTGGVTLKKLEDTPFLALLPSIAYLKASRYESAYFDPAQCAKLCKAVIVTDGKHGCKIYTRTGCTQIPAFPSSEVDPTGAGDTFLAAFVAGMSQGLSVESAALMGNYFGGIAVSQVGVPSISPGHLENWEKIHMNAVTEVSIMIST